MMKAGKKGANMPQADYEVSGGGTVFIVTPLNDSAKQNLEDNLAQDAIWFAGGVSVEHRYIVPLVDTLRQEGWSVR
jgi:hypothetical protein